MPGNMILILTGNFSNKDTENVLENFKERENNSSIPRQEEKTENSKPRSRIELKKPGITQAYMSFGFRTAPVSNPDTPALSLIDSILGTGESSRLFIELREKRALTYDFGSSNISGSDCGYFSFNCAVDVKSIEETLEVVQTEVV